MTEQEGNLERELLNDLEEDSLKKSFKKQAKPRNNEEQDSTYYLKKGKKKASAGDFRGAIQEYTKAIQLDPESYLAYCNRSMAKSNINEDFGALQDIEKSIDIKPADAFSYYILASLKLKMDQDLEEAESCLRKALMFDPNLKVAQEGLDRILSAKPEKKESKTYTFGFKWRE